MKRTLEVIMLMLMIDLISFYAFAGVEIKEIKPCQVLEEGSTNSGWKKIRISQDDKVLTGADSLPEAIKQMDQLRSQGQCAKQAQNCTLAAEGYAMGSWSRSVLMVEDQAVLGNDDLGSLVDQYNQLREKGICE